MRVRPALARPAQVRQAVATRAVKTAQATREAWAAHDQPTAQATVRLGQAEPRRRPRGARPLHVPCSDQRCSYQKQVLATQVREGAQGERHVWYLHRG